MVIYQVWMVEPWNEVIMTPHGPVTTHMLAHLRGWNELCGEYEPIDMPGAFYEERRLNR